MPGGEVLALLAFGGLCDHELEDSVQPDHVVRKQPHAIQHGSTARELGPVQAGRGPGLKNPAPSLAGHPQQPVDFTHGFLIALPREKRCLERFLFVHQLRHQQLQGLLERVFTAVGADDLVEAERCGFPIAVTKPVASGHGAAATPPATQIQKGRSMRAS
jgi:hypothetical protein